MDIEGVRYRYFNGRQAKNEIERKLVCGERKLSQESDAEVIVKCLSKVTVKRVNENWIVEKFSPHSIL